jgi:hypothetical protein
VLYISKSVMFKKHVCLLKFVMILQFVYAYENRNCKHGLHLLEAKPLNYSFQCYLQYAFIYRTFNPLKHSSYCTDPNASTLKTLEYWTHYMHVSNEFHTALTN